MAAREARTGVAGNFVALQPEVVQEVRDDREAVQHLLVGRDLLGEGQVVLDHLPQSAFLFKDQRVDGAMRKPPFRQAGVARQKCRGFPGIADDEVDARVVEEVLDELERALGVREGIAARHVREDVVVERLDAHRDAVDAAVLERLERFARDVERMEFDGEFDVGREVRPEFVQERLQVAERGRAAAEVDRRQRRVVRLPPDGGKGGDEPRHIRRAVGRGTSAARVKRTVGALRAAEGKVNVEVHRALKYFLSAATLSVFSHGKQSRPKWP